MKKGVANAKKTKSSDSASKDEINVRIKGAANSEELDLSGLNLTQIPNLQRTNWLILDISFNSFPLWPQTNPFVNLEELNIAACGLTQLASDFTHLQNLKKLSANGNKLTQLTHPFAQLTNLVSLQLANNKISAITEHISALKNLEELNLSGNPLGTVPAQMEKLVFLELLDMNGCELVQLPEEFPGMIRLMELNLGNNKLKSLPSEWGKMSRLVSLNLCDNQLSELPISMGACSMLNTCVIERNPIEDQELLRKYNIGCDHLVDYLGKKWFFVQQEKKKQLAKEKKRGPPRGNQRSNTPTPSHTPASDPSPPKPVPVSAGPTQEELSDLKKREAKFRSDTEFFSEMSQEELQKIKQTVISADAVEPLMPIARAFKELIPKIEEARSLITVPAGQPLNLPANSDPVKKLKASIVYRIREFEAFLNGINDLLSTQPSFEVLLEISTIVAGSYSILSKVNT